MRVETGRAHAKATCQLPVPKRQVKSGRDMARDRVQKVGAVHDKQIKRKADICARLGESRIKEKKLEMNNV